MPGLPLIRAETYTELDMQYEETGFQSYRQDVKNGTERLANFVARITKETTISDGINTTSILTISGMMPPKDATAKEPHDLPEIEVGADEFASMSWVLKKWGVRCVIMPVSGAKDDLRTMIQTFSDPKRSTIYKFTGWTTINGKPAYLHAGGAIGPNGNNKAVTVALPPELQKYNLLCEAPPKTSVTASLQLLELANKSLTWPLLAGTLAPLYGPCDFALHVTGRTGSFKSELASLFQAHYGSQFDARSLPGSWSSTENANQALAFLAKNAVFVVDDFIPSGSSWQQRTYQSNADKLMRSQGNQSGRARLTDTSNLQQTMYPRGLILSTGEDTPEGHSVRARMLIREISPGDIEPDDLSLCQGERPLYCGTVAWLAQSLAQEPADLKPRLDELRTSARGIGHSRTPGILARLIAVAEDFLRRARAAGFITAEEADKYTRQAEAAILEAGNEQKQFLEDADPADQFAAAVRQCLGSGGGHIRSQNGNVPRWAELLGWSKERAAGEIAGYKSRGPLIGWVNVTKNELYIDVTAGFGIIIKNSGGTITLNKQTLIKRLKESDMLTRVDDARTRNTLRVVCEGSPRQVLCMSLTKTLSLETASHDDEDDDTGDEDDEAA